MYIYRSSYIIKAEVSPVLFAISVTIVYYTCLRIESRFIEGVRGPFRSYAAIIYLI
jgi:hypothetical protein